MNKYLPYEEFEGLENIDRFDVNSISEKREIGYFFLKLILNILMDYIN